MGIDREPRLLSPEVKPPVVILVESIPDPNPSSVAFGLPATQRQIAYEITHNDERFVFPGVWALQTTKIDRDGRKIVESYFDPKTGDAITEAIFRYQHPKEAYIGDILSGRVKVPSSALDNTKF